jgi:DNA mismatch repair protein MutL
VPPLGFAIGQLNGIYILSETPEGLIIVDMHAAHERIGYERLKQAVHGADLVRQPLLMPVTVHVSRRRRTWRRSNADLLPGSGLVVDRLGETQLVVREVPALLGAADAEQIAARRAVGPRRARQQRPSSPPRSTACSRPWPATARCAPIGG